jgi:hypothetical protein
VVPAKCKYADSKSSAYLRGTCMVENKGVPDRNIGVLPVHKYANYRTLSSLFPVLIFIVIVVIIISTITLLGCRPLSKSSFFVFFSSITKKPTKFEDWKSVVNLSV